MFNFSLWKLENIVLFLKMFNKFHVFTSNCRAFWGFEERFKEQSAILFNSLDAGQQKQLLSAKPASSNSSSTCSLNAVGVSKHTQVTTAAAAVGAGKLRSRSISNDRSSITGHRYAVA
jgi:hypothetical protein